MMPDVSCKKKVIAALKRYPSQKKKMELLRFELEHPSQVSEEELIESLSLSKSMDGGGPSGHISNKTMRIALQFQDEAQRMNGEVVVQIAQELDALAHGWQTGTSRKITRLAFNLWTGHGYECESDGEQNRLSSYFLPDEIFCCCFQCSSLFLEVIFLYYTEHSGKLQVVEAHIIKYYF